MDAVQSPIRRDARLDIPSDAFGLAFAAQRDIGVKGSTGLTRKLTKLELRPIR